MDVLLSRRKKISTKYHFYLPFYSCLIVYCQLYLFCHWDAIRKLYCSDCCFYDFGCRCGLHLICNIYKIRLYNFKCNSSGIDSGHVLYFHCINVYKFTFSSGIVLRVRGATLRNLYSNWHSADSGRKISLVIDRLILFRSNTALYRHNKHILIYFTTTRHDEFI